MGSFMPEHGDTVSTAVVAVGAGATGALIAAPGAGKQIWFRLHGRAGTADGTVTLKTSAGTAISGVIDIATKGELGMSDWWPIAEGLGLSLTTVTCTFNGMVAYVAKNF